MMRFAWIILCVAGMGVALVQVRSGQNAARAEMCRLEAERLKVRRVLWQQQVLLGEPIVGPPGGAGQADWTLDLLAPGSRGAEDGVARRD